LLFFRKNVKKEFLQIFLKKCDSYTRIRIRILNADRDPATLINAEPEPWAKWRGKVLSPQIEAVVGQTANLRMIPIVAHGNNWHLKETMFKTNFTLCKLCTNRSSFRTLKRRNFNYTMIYTNQATADLVISRHISGE
jgi:hypothetical protein